MIREATTADLPDLVAIYNEAIAAGFVTGHMTPATVESRSAWFHEHAPGAHPIFVWDEEGRIGGYCSLSPYRTGRDAFRFTAEISVYIGAGFRRRGLATRMMRHAIARAPSLGFKTLVAMILEPNTASRAMVEKLGFSQWGLLPGIADFAGRECGHVFYGLRIGRFHGPGAGPG